MNTLFNLVLSLGFIAGLAVGSVFIGMNYAMMFWNFQNKKRGITKRFSLVPFAGPIVATIVLLLSTMRSGALPWLLVVPWIVDPATWVLLAAIRRNKLWKA